MQPVVALRRALTSNDIAYEMNRRGLDARLVQLHQQVDSTNRVALDLADAHVIPWTTVVAIEQTDGRGRLDRDWTSPPGRGLLMSVVLDPAQVKTPEQLSLAPLTIGLAVAATCRELSVPATVKWPNDVVIDAPESTMGFRKLAGILLERRAGVPVAGIGLNLSNSATERPVEHATSLLLERPELADEVSAAAVLASVIANVIDRCAKNPVEIAAEYRELCSTIGQRVRIVRPDGEDIVGLADDIDDDGHLLVETVGGLLTITSGDVVTLRPA